MNYFFNLIRIGNLLMIMVIQLIIQFFIANTTIRVYGIEQTVSYWELGAMILSFVLIAAGGYVINDYFDQKIDAINKPLKRVVGIKVRPEKAMILHQVLTFSGTIIGLALSYWTRSLALGIIFIILPGGLWFYSSSYKRQFIIGNVAVAFITSISVFSIGILNVAFLTREFGTLVFETPLPSQIMYWTSGFAFFAFMTTWIRELIKDIEDEFGDKELECRTMPIVWGVEKSKLFLYALIAITLFSMFYINANWIDFQGTLTIRYIIIGLLLPFIILSYLIFKAKLSSEFRAASNFTKGIMLIGVMYALVYTLLSAQKYGFTISDLIF